MKKLFTLLFIVFCITFANAQRHADLLITAVNPSGTITGGVAFNLDCKVKNLGPDVVKTTDTLNIFLVINTTIYLAYGKTFVGNTWAVNEEKQLSVLTGFKMNGTQGTYNICSFAYLFNRSVTDSISDLVSANNVGCNSVNLVWAAGVPAASDVIMNGINVYPNPVVSGTKITYALNQNSDVKISIKDMMGRDVMLVANEKQSAGMYEKELDLSMLNSGVYMVEYIVGDKVYTSKLVKN